MPNLFYVCLTYSGVTQKYIRDREDREGTKWVSKPYFTAETSQATKMTPENGVALVKRLRILGEKPWLEDVSTGLRTDPSSEEVSNIREDQRVPMRAALDDVTFYVVRPANTVNGPRWFTKAIVPGRAVPDFFYSETILGALQRAQDIGLLQFCERAPAPQVQPPVVVKQTGPVVRPGDRNRR